MTHDVQTAFDEEPLSDMTLTDVLENRAAALGEDVAIRYGEDDRDVSYAELNRTADAIGSGLAAMGIEPGDRVSVMLRDHLQTLFVMFGIHKVGAVYCPINFEYKGETLSYQIDDTEPAALVVEDQYVQRLNAVSDDLDTDPPVVVSETDADAEPPAGFDWQTLAALRDTDAPVPDVDAHWSDEAAVIYTSGTTGMPKGVVVSHRYPLAQFASYYSRFLTREDVVHCAVPLYHVGGTYLLFLSGLVAGAPVALWNRISVSEFWDRVEKYDVTYAAMPGPVMSWLLNQPEREDEHATTLNKVGPQSLQQYREVGNRYGLEFMFVGFGQTETGSPLTGIVSATDDDHGTPDELRRGLSPEEIRDRAEALGFPVYDDVPDDGYFGRAWRDDLVDVAVLDEHDERVEPGEVGELAIRPNEPDVIMKRYLGKPEQTVEAWSNLWFHTGDAVRRDADGNYVFVDRIDDVIRRRGENISSIQLQEIVNKHEDVTRTAAFAVEAEHGPDDEVGVAVEPLEGATVDEQGLRDWLETELPEFMQPKHVLVVDALPTTKTGKIEKYKLRDRIE